MKRRMRRMRGMRRNRIKEKAKEKEKKHRISIGQISKVSYDRLFFPSSSVQANHYEILRRRRRERAYHWLGQISFVNIRAEERRWGETRQIRQHSVCLTLNWNYFSSSSSNALFVLFKENSIPEKDTHQIFIMECFIEIICMNDKITPELWQKQILLYL